MQLLRQPCDVRIREILSQYRATAVGGAANQPVVAQAVTVDAVLRGEHRRFRAYLQDQGATQRGDSFATDCAGGDKTRRAVGGAADDAGFG